MEMIYHYTRYLKIWHELYYTPLTIQAENEQVCGHILEMRFYLLIVNIGIFNSRMRQEAHQVHKYHEVRIKQNVCNVFINVKRPLSIPLGVLMYKE